MLIQFVILTNLGSDMYVVNSQQNKSQIPQSYNLKYIYLIIFCKACKEHFHNLNILITWKDKKNLPVNRGLLY